MPKSVDDYLALPYHMMLQQNASWDYSGSVLELEGCFADGVTVEDTLSDLRGAMRAWLEVCLAQGLDIPLPMEHREILQLLKARTTDDKQ